MLFFLLKLTIRMSLAVVVYETTNILAVSWVAEAENYNVLWRGKKKVEGMVGFRLF